MSRLLLVTALSLGIAARAAIHFSTHLAPRINGTYYLVQVRSLLESGHLAVPDLPLIFWLQVAVARVIPFFTGCEQEQAIIFTCKLVDSVAPALLAVPVYFLLGRWRNTSTGIWVVAAALALAVIHPPLLSMTSQYEKNALGLLWFAACAVSVREVMLAPTWRYTIAVFIFLVLAGLTHIGVFAATLVFGALALSGGLVFLPAQRKSLLRLAIVSFCSVTIVLFVTWHWFDPQRIERLAQLAFSGRDFLENAAPAVPATPAGASPVTRNSTSLMPLLVLALVPMILVQTMSIGALLIVWRQRRLLPPAECVFIAATAITALFLAWPFAISERAVRLQMIAVAPLVLLVPFVLTHWRRHRFAQVVAMGILITTMASLFFTVRWKIEPAIPEDSYAELQSLRPHIADPSHTLIIARHGLEWWVVWTLRTKIAHAHAVRADDWQKYAVVAVLTHKRGTRPQAGRREDSQRVFDEFEIPPDAEILADGATFTLARLSQPPQSLAPR